MLKDGSETRAAVTADLNTPVENAELVAHNCEMFGDAENTANFSSVRGMITSASRCLIY
jgi:hypothetical protein